MPFADRPLYRVIPSRKQMRIGFIVKDLEAYQSAFEGDQRERYTGFYEALRSMRNLEWLIPELQSLKMKNPAQQVVIGQIVTHLQDAQRLWNAFEHQSIVRYEADAQPVIDALRQAYGLGFTHFYRDTHELYQ